MYFGIFHGSTYYAGTRQFLQNALTNYPATPFIDTEFGYWSREDLATTGVQVAVFDSTFMAFNEFVSVDSMGTYRAGRPLLATTWWCIFDWYSIQTGNQTMGVYKMDHATVKPVAARLRSVYKPFKESSENAVLSVAEFAKELPATCRLHQNYPNPFNPATTIVAELPVRSAVRLGIYDVLGQEVAVLLAGEYPAGKYQATWDARRMASGAYFCRLVVNGNVLTRPMLLIR